MADRNRLIVDMLPQAIDPRLEKTSESPSLPSQKCNIQEINEDNRQTHKIYHFENCGTVYVDSHNAHDVKMKNCGNNVTRVTQAGTYHCPKSIEKVLHSQPRSISNGMWTLAPSAIKHVEYVRLPALGPQHATGPLTLTAPTDIAKRNPSNVHLQTNALSPGPLQSPQPSSQSHISGDPGHWHTHHNIKYLEQLLDSSLATVALIQISGSPLQDVLSPRAYNTFKALYALAALDAPTSSTKPEESEIPTSFIFSDIGNRCPYSCNRSPPLPNSTLVPVPRTGRIHVHVSISVAYVMLFSWAGLAAVSCVLCLSICLGFAK